MHAIVAFSEEKALHPQRSENGVFPDMIVALRMVRDNEARWSNARSWFGGLPAIDPSRWPRSAGDGRPLHHVAHIDLSEIPRGPNTTPLPEAGTLSFFVSQEDSPEQVAVVFTTAPTIPLSTAPPDVPPLGGRSWRYYCRGVATEAEAPRSYRRWPIDFTLMRSVGRNYAPVPELSAKLGPKPHSIHVFDHTRLAHINSELFPWEAVRRLVRDYMGLINQHREMLASHQKRLQSPRIDVAARPEIEKRVTNALEKDRTLDAARKFIAQWSPRVEAHKRHQSIGRENAEALEAETLQLVRLGIHSHYGGGTTALKDAATDVYRDMFVGPPDLFAQIPDEIRDYFTNDRRVSGWNGRYHRMLGVTGRLYDEPDYFTHDLSLLVVESDDMLPWLWGGDCEQLGFWISSDDLAARRWEKLRGCVEQG